MSQSIDTKCVQAGYSPNNGEPRILPIVQSTTFKYDTSEEMGKLFDLESEGYFYSRLSNPTNCFTGPISINQGDRRYWAGVGFHNATAWPEDNWTVLTNKDGAIQLSAANVRLPDLDVTASGGNFTNSTIFGTGSATARSLASIGTSHG